MPLSETQSQEWIHVEQTLREPTNDYTARKVQKDRIKVRDFLSVFLNNRELVLTWEDEDGKDITRIATLFYVQEEEGDFPEMPITKEIIHGEEVEQVQHVKFYTMPDLKGYVVHVDKIKGWYTHNRGLDQIMNTANRQGKRYVRPPKEEDSQTTE